MSEARYMVGDVFERMAEIPDQSVDLIVTSPPFLALRSYLPADHPDKAKEIGSEATPAAFLSTLLALTREWRRVLAPHGSLCVELGDTYSGKYDGDSTESTGDNHSGGARLQDRRRNATRNAYKLRDSHALAKGWPLAKSLCLLPTLYPASLAYGRNLLQPDDTLDPWRVRNLIVWHRPNPPVGALGDKVRPSTSYITTACVSSTRWFDLDAERTAPASTYAPSDVNMAKREQVVGVNGYGHMTQVIASNPAGAPPLDCWTIPTAPYTGSHYATFPPALPRKLINLMCPRQVCTVCGEPRRRIVGEAEYVRDGTAVAELDPWPWGGNEVGRRGDRKSNDGGIARSAPTLGWTDCSHCGCGHHERNHVVTATHGAECSFGCACVEFAPAYRRGVVLDPFAGSGTTLMAASELGRDSIGIDLDPRNLQLAQERCGMFLTEVVA